MTSNVKSVLDSIIEVFQSGKIPEAIAISTFPRIVCPCQNWSLLNRILVYLSNTDDARGYKQWQEAKRFVKKGAKAFSILVPIFKKEKIQNGDDVPVISGFMPAPVFRFEDTDGDQLDYQKITLPNLPLLERAKELGVDVIPAPGNERFRGYYSPSKKIIALASPDECIFFHELCHRADHIIKGKMELKQDPIQEITAELGSLVLCQIVGLDGTKHIGNSYKYINAYSKELKLSPQVACLRVISEVEKIINYILKGESNV